MIVVISGCKNEKERAGGEPPALQKMFRWIGHPYNMITNQDQLSWCLGHFNHAKQISTPQMCLASHFGDKLLQLSVLNLPTS